VSNLEDNNKGLKRDKSKLQRELQELQE
jgi:DNA repair exonuclease SbcCD ATPase subunit